MAPRKKTTRVKVTQEPAPPGIEPQHPVSGKAIRRYYGSGVVWGGKGIVCSFDKATKSLDTSNPELWEKLDQCGFKYVENPEKDEPEPVEVDPLYNPPLKVDMVKK